MNDDAINGSTTTIYADDLQPGDVIDDQGGPHLVSHIDRQMGWAWPIAFDDRGWAMALGHDLVVVHRRTRCSPAAGT